MSHNRIDKDEIVYKSSKLKTIKRLLSYLKPFKLEVIIVIFLMGLIIGIDLLNPYFLKIAIDEYIAQQDILGLIRLGLIMLLIKAISFIAFYFRIKKMAAISNKVIVSIRSELFNHLQNLPLSFYNERPVGKILARVIGDVNSLNNLFTNSIKNLIPDLATIVCVMIIMLTFHWQLALVAFVTLPFLIIFVGLVEVFSHQRWRKYRNKIANTNAFTHENFSGIKVVQSFCAENKQQTKFTSLLKDSLEAFIRAIRLNNMFWPSVELSWGLGTIAVFGYGIYLLNTDNISIGLLVAFTGYIAMFWQPIMRISNFYNILVANLSGAERIFDIMDIKPSIKNSIKAITWKKPQGKVEFKDVCFGYNSEKTVLRNISFVADPGKTIAFVGPTGAGKTSIISLISRFYEPQQGTITIDNLDIKNITLESLRNNMAIVLQDNFLFSGTISDNIRYGKLDATEEEIIKACKAVFAHDFIMKLEAGYQTKINQQGSKLSFGQKQQLAFARALIANPTILILDEATAGIDTHTEKLVQKGLETLLHNRTSFIIAHRLSTIRNANQIFYIDHGKIVEKGNHQELMNKKMHYYNLYQSQYNLLHDSKQLDCVSL